MKVIGLLRITVLLLFHFSAFCQIREGTVVYDVTYPGIVMDSVAREALPSESVTTFKGDMVRIDLKSGKGIENIVIIDNKRQQVHVLMDMAGTKTAIAMNRKDVEEELKMQQLPVFNPSEETRMIAGYQCRKADAELPDGRKYTVWFTHEIFVENMNWSNQFKNVPGFLMEFTLENGTYDMQMTAGKVENHSVDAAVFRIPAEYRIIPKKELKKMDRSR